ncbi:DNA repair-scaffolding protein [Menidia menidia]
MSSRKRRRYLQDLKCVHFPDDVGNGPNKKVGKETSSLSSVSSARSWEKCGDSFLDTPVIKNLQTSGRKLSAVRKLTQSPSFGQRSASCNNEDPVQIAWSSSDSEQSENEIEQHQSRAVCKQQEGPQRSRKPIAHAQSYSSMLRLLTTDKDDHPVIDTDSDLSDPGEDIEKDSGQQISDCESTEDKPRDSPLKTTNMKELEISGYASDGENIDSTLSSSKLDSQIFPPRTGEGSKRSVSEWLRSAQAMLQTPQKLIDRNPKSPEDSAKKKRKFQSGGLAERLSRLQCRQRSAISFWRHESFSDTPAATTTTVDRPGVLVLKLLEVHEECGMQLARCAHHQPPGDAHQQAVSEDRARVLVLFSRETAAQLIPAPRDIIHIYPPWQSLSMEGFSCPVILNTHFSQKVSTVSKAATSCPRLPPCAERHMQSYLGKTFGLLEKCINEGDGNTRQVATSDALRSFGGSGILTRHCTSLLEAIEGLGQAGSVEQDVKVIVQRVYSIPLADCSPVSILKHRIPLGSSTSPPPAEKRKTRLCVLVQDGYGMFSVVQLKTLAHSDELHQFCQMWQGRTCLLKGIKVVQRVTRERRSRLFSLIDSLWPPAEPLQVHGNSLSIPVESKPPGLAPGFCYLLSGQQSSVEPAEGQILSPLYLQPTKRTLRDILQSETEGLRCSFVAAVLYTRMQSSDVGRGEVWLVLTDSSLQQEQPERPCRQTVALCVNASCVLTSSVLEALSSPAVCHMSFRDAIRENGVLLCVEQSVIQVCSAEPEGSIGSRAQPASLSPSLSEPQVKTLPQHVRLDPLSLETTPNSLCTVTGVIVGVDENTAYSWPTCNLCGSDNLKLSPERCQIFHCDSCKAVVDKPDTKVQLEVFLQCSFLSDCTVKVKLQQKTIMSVLSATALEGDEGYDVENVLGKEVGPITVYTRVVTRKPALWMGLEEICL